MKKMKYLLGLNEYAYNMPAAEPETKPAPKEVPTETPDRTPERPSPFNPPQPSINPVPKNWKAELKKCIDRFNSLYKSDLGSAVKEGLEELPSYGKFKKSLPRPDQMQFQRMGMEAMQTMMEIGRIEQENFSDEELENIAREIVKKIIDGSAMMKKGPQFSDLEFDVEFVRDPESNLGGDVPKAEKGKEESDEDIKLAISKREIVNALTQGFALTSQGRMFDEDMEELVDQINSDLLEKYFKFMRTSLESHKYMDVEMFKQMMEYMQMMQDQQGGKMSDGGGAIVPARMHIVYKDGKPIIEVKAFCLILAIQEMIKGVFEVISHFGMRYDDDKLARIKAKTENWFKEQQGFVYGPMIVNIFREFFTEVENHLIKKGVINEHDETMMYNLLRDLYDQQITPDAVFMDLFKRIFNEEIDRDMWPIEEVSKIYASAMGASSEEPEMEEPRYEEMPEPEMEDEISKIQKRAKETESKLTLDQLLDKISELGFDSLTDEEKELLKKYSQNMSRVINFEKFNILLEYRNRF
jgi:hypothetical protein